MLLAAVLGDAEVCKILLQNGSDVNAVTDTKRTALHVGACVFARSQLYSTRTMTWSHK